MSRRIYRADIGAMRPLHPAWGLWFTDLVGLNISLFSGFVLMRSDSYKRVTNGPHGPWDSTIWHEGQHHRQKKADGLVRFAFRYWFSRKWRARYEREAYEVTLAWLICHEDGHGKDGAGEAWARHIVKSMSSWKYAWMMSRYEATEWAFSLLGDLLRNWPKITWENGPDPDDA
ncbi:hypothetical protein LCGC14_0334780 [marine sediment metagenome]|uniref:Uncharacterized protein n=1 Tax=marine sediment metagenome TaxID=412755 RepID=A0A0F9TFG8_9ZZZZ